ncbi:MAG: dienelactone hydrolase family protein [Acidobacteria bacterium]|nr:dienelactone hydrolase family protein [Acidobacteriota bacterium]
MRKSFKIVAAACAVVVIVLVGFMSQRPGQTIVEAATPAEYIARLAANGDIHAGHALDEMAWANMPRQAAPASVSLPADDMGVVARLAASPRKGEFVTIDIGGSPMRAWVVRPAGAARAPVVVVIQEVFGLSDWIRGVADQLAAEGFLAVAPDLLAGKGPNGGDSTSFAGASTMQVTLQMPQAEVTARVRAAREYGLKQPNSNGKSATVGFCFGGAQSFRAAINEPTLNAAVVYYGQSPTDAPPAARGTPPAPFAPSDSLANVNAAVLGLYGGLVEDAAIGRTIEPTAAKMKQLGKTFEPHIFEGAAHGFLRAQTGNNGANMKATHQAWPLTVAWIKKHAS